MRPILLACLLALPALAGCAQPAGPDDDPALTTPQAPTDATPQPSGPSWSFTDIEGVEHSRDAPPGNATVLFFMATWCGSCRSKAPVLSQAHEAYADEGVRFYSLDVDAAETPEQLRAWQERYAQPWPHGVDTNLRLQRLFGVTSQSSVVVLDGNGHVAKRWGYGGVTAEGLRETLDALLAPTPS